MQIKAAISPGYMARLVVVAIITLIGGLWFSYDGFIGYPHQQKVSLAYMQFQEEGRVDQWSEYAKSKGWAVTPESPKSNSDIWLQRILGMVALPIGMVFGLASLRSLGRYVCCDDAGLSSSTYHQIPFESITKLDKSRWQKKGIVVVHFTLDGKPGRIVLDDWKMNTDNTEQILRTIEQKTGMGTTAAPDDAAPSTDTVVTS
jgi:hypothetical protein